ncbi:MAG: ORF6N domain-containing protein [Ruminiclostridium sp.]
MLNLIPVEFKNQRVITTKVLAEQFGTDEKNISKNFTRNEERFQEGKHYYRLEGATLAEFKTNHLNDESSMLRVNCLYLWTERGAARHAKILETDEAWQVYETLEETYFRMRESKPTCLEDIMIQSLQEMKAMKQQINEARTTAVTAIAESQEVKQELQNIRDTIALDTTSWRSDTTKIINSMARNLGGNEHIRDIRTEAYQLLDRRFAVSLETRLTNKRRRMADEGVCKSKRDRLNQLDVIADDKKLIEGFVSIIKQMAVKYGVSNDER